MPGAGHRFKKINLKAFVNEGFILKNSDWVDNIKNAVCLVFNTDVFAKEENKKI